MEAKTYASSLVLVAEACDAGDMGGLKLKVSSRDACRCVSSLVVEVQPLILDDLRITVCSVETSGGASSI
jgi:hypothetical protein